MPKPNQTKRTTIRWIKRVLLVAGAVAIVAVIVRALVPQPIPVDVAPATRGPLDVEVREDGQTRVRDRFAVSAPISGDLRRVPVEAGAWVDAGAVVARIDPPSPALLDERTRGETTARLAAAQARERAAGTQIARAKDSLELAAREAQRTRELFERGAVTGLERERTDLAAELAQEDLTAAQAQRAAAAAEIRALRAVLEPARGERGRTVEVTAPTRGRVLRVVRESAGPIAAGAPILEIGDPRSLEVVIDVLSQDAERIAPGMDVYIDTASAQPIRGTVTLVEPSAFTRISALGIEEQRVNVIACFEAPESIGDAFRVDARIITWHGDDVLRVPASTLFRDRGHWAVFVLEDGRARLRRVDIGHRGRTEVEITRGLRAGERVLVHPSDQISDGTRVEPRA